MSEYTSFGDWLADKLGTRRWCVANRLGSRMAEKYDLAISAKRYNALFAEFHALYPDEKPAQST